MGALVLGNFDVAAILAEKKVAVDQKDTDGNTALHNASYEGRADIVKIILGKYHCLNKQNKRGNTSLMLALLFDHFYVAAMLANEMIDVDQENKDGNIELHYASEKGRADVVKTIFDKTFDKARCLYKQNTQGNTPLMLAEKYGHNAVADMIQSFRDRTN